MSATDGGAAPSAVKGGLTFWPIPEFDGPSQAFGADASAYFDRSKRPKVPRQFEDMVDTLFFSGGRLPEFAPEVDRVKAAAATRAWLSSFAPPHESKVATVAYAFWVWSTPAALASAGAVGESGR